MKLNNKGFSLISTVVAMGIAMLTLSLTCQLMLLNQRQANTARVNLDILGYVQEQRDKLVTIGASALNDDYVGKDWSVSRIDKITTDAGDTITTKYVAVIQRAPMSIIGPEFVVRDLGSVVVKNIVVLQNPVEVVVVRAGDTVEELDRVAAEVIKDTQEHCQHLLGQ